jgi:hypothetical protein
MAGGGAGHMLDMIHKVRENLSMLPSKKDKFKKHGKESFSIAPPSEKYKFRKVSGNDLEKALSKIKEDTEKERKRRIIGSVVSGIITLLILILILQYIDRTFSSGRY